MAKPLEEGLSEKPSWAKDVENYLAHLRPSSHPGLLDAIRAKISGWDKFHHNERKKCKDRWSDRLPWIWDMKRLLPNQCSVSEQTFESVDGFYDSLQIRRQGLGHMRIILICSYIERRQDVDVYLLPRSYYRWASFITLALLGSYLQIPRDLFFPAPWAMFKDRSDYKAYLKEGELDTLSLDGLKLPSQRSTTKTTLTKRDEIAVEDLYLAVNFSSLPFRKEPALWETFNSHYDKPGYGFLRLVKTSETIETSQKVDTYIVIFDSTITRNYFKRSCLDVDSINQSVAILHGNFPIFLVRSAKQYVLNDLCHSLVQLKVNLQEVNYAGRADPSYNKLNYVLHLQDHLKMMSRFLQYVTKELPGIPDSVPLDHTDSWPSDFEKDQDYIREVIADLRKEIEQVQKIIGTQLEVKNSSRNKLVAVLAAIYLPFSLATSIFGMNIKEINNSSPGWWSVPAVGLPLAIVTVALPLGFNFAYGKVKHVTIKYPKASGLIATITGIALLITVTLAIIVTSRKK